MTLRAVLLFLATLAFLAPTFVFNMSGGFDPTLFPNPQVRPPVQPVDWAFAIWGLIYLGLLAHAAFGLILRRQDIDWNHPRSMLAISLVLGAFWLALAQINAIGATVLIFVMAGFALRALFRTPWVPGDAAARWLLMAPIALYAGWLSAASFVALGVLGAGYGIFGLGEIAWAWIALPLAGLAVLAVQARLGRAPDYSVAAAWAFAGVAIRNVTYDGGEIALALLAGALAVIVLVFAVSTRGRAREREL